jgi:MFS transporter, DHA2 family, multidrug resistance protein
VVSAYSAGAAIGPVVGGLLIELFWWGSVFLIAVPVMALLLLLGPRVLPEFKNPNARSIDLPSVALSLVAILSVVYGLKQTAQDGVTPLSSAAIVLGLLVGYLFTRRQRHLADPLADPALFGIPRFRAGLLVYLLAILVSFGYFLLVPQYLQLVLGLPPLQAGLWSVAPGLGFVVGTIAASRLVRWVPQTALMAGGLVVAAVGLLMLGGVGTTRDSLLLLVGAAVVVSLGLAPLFSILAEIVVGAAPPEKAGAASGIYETGAELGGTFGIAILGSVGIAVYRAALSDTVIGAVPAQARAVARDTLGGAVVAASHLPGPSGDLLLTASREAFVEALHAVAEVSAVLAVAGSLLVILALRARPSQSRLHTTEQPVEEADQAVAS